jgi:hypothetical protein
MPGEPGGRRIGSKYVRIRVFNFVIESSVQETRERPTVPLVPSDNGSGGCIIARAVVIVVRLMGRGKLDCISVHAEFESEAGVVVFIGYT